MGGVNVSKKKICIILVIMLSIFAAVMTVIIIKNNKKVDLEDTNITEEAHYAQNPVKAREGLTQEEIEEAGTIKIDNITYSGLENLTFEQMADKSNLTRLINSSLSSGLKNKNLSIKVDPERSTEKLVYVDVTSEDGTSDTYVVMFDNYNCHKFIRCATLEYYNYIHNY